MRGARFENVDLTGAVFREAMLVNARISGLIHGLVINDVEVAPLIRAEMDRRYPERTKLTPTSAEGAREAWSVVEALWATTLERVRWARVVNLARALEEIGEAGFWRIGLAGDAETELKDALGPPRVALVLGAEGPGLRLNTREHCDALARLPISDAVESLNVSNAAAIALYAASTHG